MGAPPGSAGFSDHRRNARCDREGIRRPFSRGILIGEETPMRYLVLLAMISIPVFGQKPESEQPVLQTLISEVQQLRLAIGRSTLLGAPTQLVWSRLQMDESWAAKLSQALGDARGEAIHNTSRRTELAE